MIVLLVKTLANDGVDMWKPSSSTRRSFLIETCCLPKRNTCFKNGWLPPPSTWVICAPRGHLAAANEIKIVYEARILHFRIHGVPCLCLSIMGAVASATRRREVICIMRSSHAEAFSTKRAEGVWYSLMHPSAGLMRSFIWSSLLI